MIYTYFEEIEFNPNDTFAFVGTRDRRGEKLAVKSVVTHILHLAPTNGIRGYKNEVRLRGLM